MAIPQLVAESAQVSGASALTVPWPAGHAAGDVGILIVETGGEGTTLSITAPAGWATVTGSPVTGVATTAGSKLQVFWRRATSSAETSVTVPDSGDHQLARLVVFNGCSPTGNPWDVVVTGNKTTASSSITFPALTTTVAETTVVFIATRPNDGASVTSFGALTNATLTNQNASGSESGTTAGHGGGFVYFTGEKTTAGAVGSSTTTVTPSSTNAYMVIALRGDPSVTVSMGVGNAAAAGSAFALNQKIDAGAGSAVAAGSTASISQFGLRVTWAEAAYQANTAVTISCNVGNAVAAGSTAGVSLYAARITWAEAQYQASPNVSLPMYVGNAVAAGTTAGVTVYGAVRITWAEAQYQATSGTTIPFTIGNAVAGGPAGTTVSENITIVPTVGNAVAGGPSGASVSVDASIDCGIGDATAAGQQCQVLLPLTVAPSATPGYAPKTRYRVRVGRRWLEVDPLDPMSVRRAYDVAQEDAQDAATQDVEAPAAVAAQAVVVQPIKGPDYAGLAAEARRISEDIRKVYADALQTALIARLMREQIERDDEDDIAVLLASI